MEVKLLSNFDISKTNADLLVFAVFENSLKFSLILSEIDKRLNKQLSKIISYTKFIGKKTESILVNTNGLIPAKYILVVGLGEKEKYDAETLRLYSSEIVKQSQKIKAKNVVVFDIYLESVSGLSPLDTLKTFLEVAFLRNHNLINYKTSKDDSSNNQISTLSIFSKVIQKKIFDQAYNLAKICSDATNKTRDLVNMPSNLLTPKIFTEIAKRVCKESKLKLKVLDSDKIKSLQMGAIWGVGKGSNNMPNVLVIEYYGAKSKSEIVALIGKGVTFDSGGISLKPSKKLDEMKQDMAGAATVLYSMEAIARLRLKKNVIAVIPLVENMPSGGALKPGDIIKTFSGKTVEIISTDAEGRLIIADAITYAKKLGATRIMDFATLTGACIVALGDLAAAILGNDEEYIKSVILHAEKSGERLWQLPLYEEYREYLKSDMADIKNCSDLGKAGTATGAIFIKEFVGDIPWVHIDIASVAVLDREARYLPKGPTGYGVFTAINYLLNS